MNNSIIIGNWKMNTTLADAVVLATGIKKGTENVDGVEIVLCPPSVWLVPVQEALGKSFNKKIALGAQNIFWEDEGAYTGEISPKMIKNICKYAIIGHSERRRYLFEDNIIVNKKVHGALLNNLTAVLCIGEHNKLTDEKKGRGRPTKKDKFNNIFYQLEKSLLGITKKMMQNVIIAYEPIWAIGTGKPATGIYAVKMIFMIRERIAKIYDWKTASSVKILYGGSVTSDNILEFTGQPEINGVLAGGASLKAKEFVKMCQLAAK